MEMKQISDSTLKITIPMDDLEDRGMSLSDFMVPQEKTEDFFYAILEELDMPDTFRESGMLSFRVTPKPNKVDIFVTKSEIDQNLDFDDLADLSDLDDLSELTPEEFFKTLEKSMREKTKADSKAIAHLAQVEREEEVAAQAAAEAETGPTTNYIYFVLTFDSLLEVVRYVRAINYPVENSELYKMSGRYYLTILIDVAGQSAIYPQNLLSRMLEHSDDVEISRAMLEEYGRNLLRVNAVQELARVVL